MYWDKLWWITQEDIERQGYNTNNPVAIYDCGCKRLGGDIDLCCFHHGVEYGLDKIAEYAETGQDDDTDV